MGLTPQRPIYRSYKQDPQELERYLNKTFPELRALAQRSFWFEIRTRGSNG
jgi:hypothetical protein